MICRIVAGRLIQPVSGTMSLRKDGLFGQLGLTVLPGSFTDT
jgi:hypothetical protein